MSRTVQRDGGTTVEEIALTVFHERLDLDLDENGATDLADVICCLRAVCGRDEAVSFSGDSDGDQDGSLGLAEAVFILQVLSNIRQPNCTCEAAEPVMKKCAIDYNRNFS